MRTGEKMSELFSIQIRNVPHSKILQIKQKASRLNITLAQSKQADSELYTLEGDEYLRAVIDLKIYLQNRGIQSKIESWSKTDREYDREQAKQEYVKQFSTMDDFTFNDWFENVWGWD